MRGMRGSTYRRNGEEFKGSESRFRGDLCKGVFEMKCGSGILSQNSSLRGSE